MSTAGRPVPATRFGLGIAVVTGVLDRLVRGELRSSGMHTEYCDSEVIRRLRRASLARLRAEVEPAALGGSCRAVGVCGVAFGSGG